MKLISVDGIAALTADGAQISAAPDGLRSLMQGGDLGCAFADLDARTPRPAPPVLAKLLDRSATWQPVDGPKVVNLTLLPRTDEDLEWQAQALGEGAVTILSCGCGNCRVTGRRCRRCGGCSSTTVRTPCDPAEGDDYRQVLPGTAFADLPDDWHCPGCGAPKTQFMVLADPGQLGADIARRAALLEADFREIWNAGMKHVPIVNMGLHVQAVGVQTWGDQVLGMLISPWFRNLILLPGTGQDWIHLHPLAQEVVSFPSGDYEFLHNTRQMVGGHKGCSLFSPAVEVARAVLAPPLDGDNRAGTDRAAEIRSANSPPPPRKSCAILS